MPLSPRPDPDDTLDHARAQTQAALERAVGEGRLTLEAYTERIGAVWSATSRAELDLVVADLPTTGNLVLPTSQSTMVSIFGDIKRSGRWRLGAKTTGWLVFGDLKLDLRTAVITDPAVTINAWSLFGDVELLVPEGVEVELSGFDVFGDRVLEIAPAPATPGGPRLRVRAFSLFGDVRVRSST